MKLGDIKTVIDLVNYCNGHPWQTVFIISLVIIAISYWLITSFTKGSKATIGKHFDNLSSNIVKQVEVVIDLRMSLIKETIDAITCKQKTFDKDAEKILTEMRSYKLPKRRQSDKENSKLSKEDIDKINTSGAGLAV